MGLFNILKKKEVPDTLPSLGQSSFQKREGSIISSTSIPSPPAPVQKREESITNSLEQTEKPKYKPLPSAPVRPEQELPEKKGATEKKASEEKWIIDEEKSFFRELMGEITKEIADLDGEQQEKSERVLESDMVGELREYWEKQKPELLIKRFGNEVRTKIEAKTTSLHTLEKEWQSAYLSLIAKEDEIRKEEKELKNILEEFKEACKRANKGVSSIDKDNK